MQPGMRSSLIPATGHRVPHAPHHTARLQGGERVTEHAVAPDAGAFSLLPRVVFCIRHVLFQFNVSEVKQRYGRS